MATTGVYTSNKEKITGGVILEDERSWEFGNIAPREIRKDIGPGHQLHWAYMTGVCLLANLNPNPNPNPVLCVCDVCVLCMCCVCDVCVMCMCCVCDVCAVCVICV
jgi:hypothetical protein